MLITKTASASGKIITLLSLHLGYLLTCNRLLIPALFALTLVSRLPFQSRMLYHWDSVNFAFAMREFNLAQEQPQPPGYIVYVWLCRLASNVLGDAQTTMTSLSILSSALAMIGLYCLGQIMFGRRVGLVAALFLVTSPLFWFYGEIALPHTLDTLLIIVAVWWLYATMRGKTNYLFPAVIILAIAGGVRQQTLVFLGPLALFALRNIGWPRMLLGALFGLLLCLIWFMPLTALSGGISNYFQIMEAFSDRFQQTTSVLMGAGWPGIQRNLIKLGLYTPYAWGAALIPAALWAGWLFWRRVWPQGWEKTVFLALWVIPALLFYALIHMGQQGLVFVFLPALLLWSAVGLVHLTVQRPKVLIAATSILIALNGVVFCFAPEYPLGPGRQRLLTRETLANSDHYYQDRFEAIKQHFPPESTLILAANWHHVEYYLPAYRRLAFNIGAKWEHDAGTPANDNSEALRTTPAGLGLSPNAQGQTIVVIFDPELGAFNEIATQMNQLALAHGGEMFYFAMSGDDQLYLDTDSFGMFQP
jgi:hypothetical protein